MPCFCWIDDNEIEPELIIIRQHTKEIVKLMKEIHGKGDLYPSKESSPAPRHIKDDVHKLLDDIWEGKCNETGKEIF